MKLIGIALAGALIAAGGPGVASAQTMSYSEAGALIARSCGKDITRFCAKVNMGGGALRDCLMKTQAKLNPQCVADYKAVSDSLAKRAAAQAAVPQVCKADARQYCNGVAYGNGHFLSCLNASTRVVSTSCKQALADAGWN
ncbi:hypothetical protein GCM10007874_36870 [Labrys miyagiensis]|uniref:Cysteine rich repeat-containing protein n=2 Tax=Labrys miyagiensis TaxID=346912 RepID=A0ABQ6CLH5_9HYPH|nr:hypothetical protein GCM10007874_36870 [Labrys miyagiensis]